MQIYPHGCQEKSISCEMINLIHFNWQFEMDAMAVANIQEAFHSQF